MARTTRFMYSSNPIILPSIRRSVFSKSQTWIRVFCEREGGPRTFFRRASAARQGTAGMEAEALGARASGERFARSGR